jgi:integrating conjugative element protein (TIGR03756 family)
MKFKQLSIALCTAATLTAGTYSKADTITTAEVITKTTSAFFNCADYEVVGVCFWLYCTITGCTVKTSAKVAHYNPEITTQTYRNAEKPPWVETRVMLDAMQAGHDGSLISIILDTMGAGLDELGGGAGSENKAASHSNMTFTLTDSFGNPVLLASKVIGASGYVCDPKLTPMYPYYVSNLDTVAWRFSIPEMFYPQSLNPFGSLLGSNSYNWGGYYPRIGHVTNHDLVKESGLIAFRSAHFLSRRGESHVYTSIAQNSREGFWPPGPLTKSSGKWQQLAPKGEASCKTFPLSAGTGPSDGLSGYRSDDGAHVWNLWRRYKCCKDRGDFLYDIEW